MTIGAPPSGVALERHVRDGRVRPEEDAIVVTERDRRTAPRPVAAEFDRPHAAGGERSAVSRLF